MLRAIGRFKALGAGLSLVAFGVLRMLRGKPRLPCGDDAPREVAVVALAFSSVTHL
jgi:hypothetical protein